ncbi:MAG: hypothetical protein MH219_08975 [Marinobacter sp.]|nr:hypothetical protein [Marinobacter sp.]
MVKSGRAFFLCLLTTSALTTGCGELLGESDKSANAPKIIKQAIKNQVFVDGGTFMLGGCR